MSSITSRRGFLGAAASGVAITSLSAITQERSPAVAVADDEPAEVVGDGIATHTTVFPAHWELAQLRSQQEQERVATSLLKTDARPLIVAACQFANHCGGAAGKEANLVRMLRAIDAASALRVQVIAFPELCLPGYLVDGTPQEAARITHALADRPGESGYLTQLTAAAKEHQMVVAFGFCERHGDDYYNAIGLIDADGAWLGSRRKNPLSPHPHETEVFREPDASERTAVFNTHYGIIGLANCFDGEFPESIRRMRLAGAELLLWCNAGTGIARTGHSSRINASACYAQANRMWVVCCNAVAGNFYGTSVIVGPSGEPLVVLPPAEEALGIATINLAHTADWPRWRDRLEPIGRPEG